MREFWWLWGFAITIQEVAAAGILVHTDIVTRALHAFSLSPLSSFASYSSPSSSSSSTSNFNQNTNKSEESESESEERHKNFNETDWIYGILKRHPESLNAGSFFPDWGYGCFGLDEEAEVSHWPPFIVEFASLILSRPSSLSSSSASPSDSLPLDRNKTKGKSKKEIEEKEEKIAFLFGMAIHGTSDATWHSIRFQSGFLRIMADLDFEGDYNAAHSVLDVGADCMLAHLHSLPAFSYSDSSEYGKEERGGWKVPVDDLVATYAKLNFTVPPLKVRYCMARGYAGLTAIRRLGSRLYPQYAKQSPFMVRKLQSWYLGGLQEVVETGVRCWGVLEDWVRRGKPTGGGGAGWDEWEPMKTIAKRGRTGIAGPLPLSLHGVDAGDRGKRKTVRDAELEVAIRLEFDKLQCEYQNGILTISQPRSHSLNDNGSDDATVQQNTIKSTKLQDVGDGRTGDHLLPGEQIRKGFEYCYSARATTIGNTTWLTPSMGYSAFGSSLTLLSHPPFPQSDTTQTGTNTTTDPTPHSATDTSTDISTRTETKTNKAGREEIVVGAPWESETRDEIGRGAVYFIPLSSPSPFLSLSHSGSKLSERPNETLFGMNRTFDISAKRIPANIDSKAPGATALTTQKDVHFGQQSTILTLSNGSKFIAILSYSKIQIYAIVHGQVSADPITTITDTPRKWATMQRWTRKRKKSEWGGPAIAERILGFTVGNETYLALSSPYVFRPSPLFSLGKVIEKTQWFLGLTTAKDEKPDDGGRKRNRATGRLTIHHSSSLSLPSSSFLDVSRIKAREIELLESADQIVYGPYGSRFGANMGFDSETGVLWIGVPGLGAVRGFSPPFRVASSRLLAKSRDEKSSASNWTWLYTITDPAFPPPLSSTSSPSASSRHNKYPKLCEKGGLASTGFGDGAICAHDGLVYIGSPESSTPRSYQSGSLSLFSCPPPFILLPSMEQGEREGQRGDRERGRCELVEMIRAMPDSSTAHFGTHCQIIPVPDHNSSPSPTLSASPTASASASASPTLSASPAPSSSPSSSSDFASGRKRKGQEVYVSAPGYLDQGALFRFSVVPTLHSLQQVDGFKRYDQIDLGEYSSSCLPRLRQRHASCENKDEHKHEHDHKHEIGGNEAREKTIITRLINPWLLAPDYASRFSAAFVVIGNGNGNGNGNKNLANGDSYGSLSGGSCECGKERRGRDAWTGRRVVVGAPGARGIGKVVEAGRIYIFDGLI